MKSLKPNDLGNKILVEQCQKIEINRFVEKAKNKLKKQLVKADLKANGYNIELTSSETVFGGERLWFKCPFCNNRVGVLYRHPISEIIGCRDCLDLEYKSRRFKGMIEDKI